MDRQEETQTQLMTRAHLAMTLNISERTIQRYETKGLPVIWIGTLPRYDYDKVVAWFQNYKLKGGEQYEQE